MIEDDGLVTQGEMLPKHYTLINEISDPNFFHMLHAYVYPNGDILLMQIDDSGLTRSVIHKDVLRDLLGEL